MDATIGLPELFGSPIHVRALPHLTAHNGNLLSADPARRGSAVHAASFLRRREIILETQLLAHTAKLRLILVHEIFHFVWLRLGNLQRAAYRFLIESEINARARGELGESAQTAKTNLPSANQMTQAHWRNYICESFCDSGAWLYAGVRSSKAWTLSSKWRQQRERWFQTVFSLPRGC